LVCNSCHDDTAATAAVANALANDAQAATQLPKPGTTGCRLGSRLSSQIRAELGCLRRRARLRRLRRLRVGPGAIRPVPRRQPRRRLRLRPVRTHWRINALGATVASCPPRTTHRRQASTHLGTLQVAAAGHVTRSPGPLGHELVRAEPPADTRRCRLLLHAVVGDAACYAPPRLRGSALEPGREVPTGPHHKERTMSQRHGRTAAASRGETHL
jgi:hypothetical protein